LSGMGPAVVRGNKMNLSHAEIVGYFDLPGIWLASHNPAAYALAMQEAPAGAGTCAHCGAGIRHHVIVVDADGVRRFIGCKCAERVGIDAEAVRERLTTEQMKAHRERRARWQAAEVAREVEREAARVRRLAVVGDIVELLYREHSEFHASLAAQLAVRPLSERQAHFVAKLTSATGRRNKKNAEAWDALLHVCTSTTEEIEAANAATA